MWKFSRGQDSIWLCELLGGSPPWTSCAHIGFAVYIGIRRPWLLCNLDHFSRSFMQIRFQRDKVMSLLREQSCFPHVVTSVGFLCSESVSYATAQCMYPLWLALHVAMWDLEFRDPEQLHWADMVTSFLIQESGIFFQHPHNCDWVTY